MKKVLFLLLLAIGSQAQNWSPSTYSVKFKIRMMGLGVNGKMNGLKVKVASTGNEINSITASIDAASVDTDNSLRDKHLKEKPEFFEVKKYPELQLVSTAIVKNPSGGFIGTFNLTIKNVTKSLKIPFSFEPNGDVAALKANISINRKDWNFGGDTPGMADKVDLNLSLNLKK